MVTQSPQYRPTPPPVQNTDVVGIQTGLINNPSLAVGTAFNPVLQGVNQNELLGTTGLTGTVAATAVDAQQQAPTTTTQAATTTVDPSVFDPYSQADTGQYDPTKVSSQTPQATAQQAVVDPSQTVEGRMEALLNPPDGEVPLWARGAVREAESRLASRGLGRSSIAGESIAAAYINSALPIASADANIYFQTNMANLQARQQTELANLQARQQTLLSDQSAINAAKQFNASNAQQHSQFFAGLMSSIVTTNANMLNTMEQFNAAEANRQLAIETQNAAELANADAQRRTAVSQFNAELKNAREQFNVQNQQIIDQSNVLWRRTINTANTAAENAAIQANVQNLFNLSNQALASIWQQWRDEASWANQSAENERDRAHNIALAALNRDTQFSLIDDQQQNDFYELLGQFGINLLLS